jgi:hypothetical protein
MLHSKLPIDGRVRVRVYDVLSDAVEGAVTRGWYRAHKHTDAPGEDYVCNEIREAVMGALCDLLDFGD